MLEHAKITQRIFSENFLLTYPSQRLQIKACHLPQSATNLFHGTTYGAFDESLNMVPIAIKRELVEFGEWIEKNSTLTDLAIKTLPGCEKIPTVAFNLAYSDIGCSQGL